MATGQRNTGTDTSLQKRVIRTHIENIDWQTAPTLKRLGVNNESKWKFINWPPAGLIETIEDTNSPTTSTLSASVSSTSSTTATVADGTRFHAGHIVLVDTEQMYITGVSGNTVTWTRGFGSTTAATHSSAATVTIVGLASVEGSNYVLGHSTNPSTVTNYQQEMQEAIEVTWRQKGVRDYGKDAGELEYQLQKLIGGGKVGERGKAGVLARHLENMMWYGKKTAGSAGATPSTAGGFDAFVSTNLVGSTTTELTRPLIHQCLRQIVEDGGMPNLMIVDAWGMEKITAMYEGSIRTERTDKYGGSVINHIVTPFGELEVFWDWMKPTGTAHILDTDKVGWLTIDPFDVYDVPSLGTYDVKMVWGNYSFMVLTEKSHGKITYDITK
jgi:hypothetical protein